MISSGRLRHRVTLQEQVNVIDPETGARDVIWQSRGKAWAAVEPLSAREFIQSAATQSRVTAKIVMRKRDIGPSWRILHGDTMYNVEGILADKDSGIEYITVPVSAGVNDGR